MIMKSKTSKLWDYLGARTDVGKVRGKNEDAHYVDPKGRLFVVADGLGGHPAGEVASEMAVEEIVRFLHEDAEPGEERLRAAVQSANSKVFEESLRNATRMGMGTTVVVALIRESTLWLAHVGGSHAYLITDAGLAQLTMDHTLFYEVSHGNFWERYRYAGPLLRAVGIESEVEIVTRTIHFRGEGVMLCTDGLTNMLT